MNPFALLAFQAFLCSSSPAAAADDARFREAEAQVQLLEQGNARQRRDAGKKLLELGFYARDAVQKGMKHADPEVAATCATIWKEIEAKVCPVEVAGLGDFIKSAHEKHINGTAWAEVVKSQGPAALVLAEPFLRAEVFAAEEGEEEDDEPPEVHGLLVMPNMQSRNDVSRDDKLSLFLNPLLDKDDGAALVAWAEAAPAQRALCLKALALVQPGDSLGTQNSFLKLLLKLDHEAILPHLENLHGLPSADLAKLLMNEKALQEKMKAKGGQLLALLRSLPLVLAESRDAKMAALKDLPEDAFVEADELLCESLILLGDAGLATESKKLKAGEGQAGKWRQFAEDVLAGKVEDVASRCEEMQESASANGSYHVDVALALLGNGEPAGKRLAAYLVPSHDNDTAFAALQVESLEPDPDIAQMRAQGGLPEEFLLELEKGEKFYAQVSGLNEGIQKSYQLYLLASLRHQPDAVKHLDEALKNAPASLPLLLEKALVTPEAERPAAIRLLTQALPIDLDLGGWLLNRLADAHATPDAATLASWMKKLDLSTVKETDPALTILVKICLENHLDASILLPVLKEPSLNKALLTLSAGRRDEALTLLKTMNEDAKSEPSRFLEHLLGAARPSPKAEEEIELLACLAGLEGAVCPTSPEEQKHAVAVWKLGKGFACLRKGELKGAAAALEAAKKAADCGCVESWCSLYQICLANPQMLAPTKP